MILNSIQNRNKILGMNERNYEFVKRYNSRAAREIADNKLLTKRILKTADVPTTEIIAVIRNHNQLESFDFSSLPKSFVIKPVNGVEGGGIEIFYNRDKRGDFIGAGGSKMSEDALRSHITEILEGRYSLSYFPDQALIEERVQPYKKFRPYIYKGTPDVRVVVFRNVPVMAMIRWPTRRSQGKANASIGAVASGIDISTGVTTHSIQEDGQGQIRLVDYVEGSYVRYSGFKIPYWEKILRYSITAARASGLGFCAVDFLIDRKLGPLVVELNARPGLRIQVANQDGLKWRLKQVKQLQVKSDLHAIRLGKDLFGGEIEEEIQAIAGKKIISLIQPVKLYHKSKPKSIVTKAKVDTGAGYSSIDVSLAKELGYSDALKFFESFNVPDFFETKAAAREVSHAIALKLFEHPDIVRTHIISSSNGFSVRFAVELKVKINDVPLTLEANVRDRSQLQYSMLLGRRDLKSFLIDPRL